MHAHHPNDLGPDAKVAEVKKAVKVRMEHFDCAQFLGSYCSDEGETINIYYGQGNWYGRQGMARDFLNKDQAHMQAQELKSVMPQEPPDDGEAWKQ